jgi:hypothetical protein
MHISNGILNSLDIDSSDFRYTSKIPLFDEDKKKPFGKVTFVNGHYRLTVGDIHFFELEPNRDDRRH